MAEAENNYYRILDLPRDATVEEVKAAHRALVRELHPDRTPDDPDAEQRFMRVQQAYEVLSDPEARERYDKGQIDSDDDNYNIEEEVENADLDTIMSAVFGKRRS